MKRNTLIAALLLTTPLITKADLPVFGNSPDGSQGLNMSVYNGQLALAAAVEFTPTENINISSVTLWLNGYDTGPIGLESVNLAIYNNLNGSNSFGTATNIPYNPLIEFSSPAPNGGSTAAFTFSNPTGNSTYNPSGSTVLLANTSYWLFVTEGGPNFGNYLDFSQWVGGSTPTGDAVYDSSLVENYSGPTLTPSSIIPAFTINAVPEPGVASLMVIPLLFGIGRVAYRKVKGL